MDILKDGYERCLLNYVRFPNVTVIMLLRKNNKYYIYLVPNGSENTLYTLNDSYDESKALFLKVWHNLKFKHKIEDDTVVQLNKLNSIAS